MLQDDDARITFGAIDEVSRDGEIPNEYERDTLRVMQALAYKWGQVPPGYQVDQDSLSVDSGIIANGAYADVRVGKLGDKVVAIRTLRIDRQTDLHEARKRFCKKSIIWMNISHPNILRLIAVDIDPLTNKCSMISEMMNGNIREYIRKNSANRHQLLQETAAGLYYLHERGIVHGDLKGHNILITNETPPRACLADFGLSTLTPSGPGETAIATTGGTPLYMAPELLCPTEFGKPSARPTQPADIYALGMVIYEILSGFQPFHDQMCGVFDLAYRVVGGARPPKPDNAEQVGFGDGTWELVEECWSQESTRRPGIERVFTHLTRVAASSAVVSPTPDGPLQSTNNLPEFDSSSGIRLFRSATATTQHRVVTAVNSVSRTTMVETVSPVSTISTVGMLAPGASSNIRSVQSSITPAPNDECKDPHRGVKWQFWPGHRSSLPPRRSYLATKLSIEPEEMLNPTIPLPMLRPKVSKFGSRATTKERKNVHEKGKRKDTLGGPEVTLDPKRPGIVGKLLERAFRRAPGALPPTRDISERQVGNTPTEPDPQHPPQASRIPETPSPFIVKTPAGTRQMREVRREQLGDFRVWHDSTGFHRHEAALVDYSAGIVHLSSPDGTLLEIPEGKLCQVDIDHVRSRDIYKGGERKESERGSCGPSGSDQLGCVHGVVQYLPVPPESQPPTLDPIPQPPPASTASMSPLELWEADLNTLSRVDKAGTLSDPERKKVQEFADRLDVALGSKDLLKPERKQYLTHLRKLCCTFDILPSSFVLMPTFDEREATPFATGGFSDVYEATLDGRRVAVKVLKVNTQTIKSVRQLLIKEVVGWKCVRHENVLPFVGVMSKPPLFSIISERMENGNIMDFIEAHPSSNRLRLLTGAVVGLEYLHEHDIIHGDLKGVNILIDSERCARLADFGLAVIADESTAGNREMRGTVRWMAPEIILPEKFGYVGGLLKQLPSKSTDIYAIGMTIFEVLTGCCPFNDSSNIYSIMFKVVTGDRPNRPASGFSDTLWDLLVSTWVVEDGPESKRRPSASAVLDQLKKDVDHWGKSIVPLVPKEWQESGSNGARIREEVDAPNSSQTVMPYALHADQDKTIQRDSASPGIADRLDDSPWLG